MKLISAYRCACVFTFAAVCALLCLVSPAHAQLPNAWQVSDHSTSGGAQAQYITNLPSPQQFAATNSGFDFTVHARLVTNFSGPKAIGMIYGLGSRRFLIWWNLNASNDLTAELEGGSTYTLTTNGTGAALYHTHKIIYDPANASASYLFDGQVKTTNWPGSAIAFTAGRIHWGSGSSTGQGQVNFHSVNFDITGLGNVASYDAGTSNNPAIAPDPTNSVFGWTLSPASLPANVTVTNISPDTVPLPITPVATTLDATNVTFTQATLAGVINQGNLAATAWLEWGRDTNYGSTTPPQALLSDTNNFNLSQTITGLVKGVTYHFRCVASNTLGVAYGEDAVLTTPLAFTVTTAADSGPGSLRQAILDSSTGDLIIFSNTLSGATITLTSGALVLTNELTIAGPGPANLAISGNNASRVFEVGSGFTNTISGLTIKNGKGANGSNGNPGNPGEDGGGILNSGSLTLSNCIITANQAGKGGNGNNGGNGSVGSPNGGNGRNAGRGGYGGGIYNLSAGSLSLVACTATNNSSGAGGKGGDGGDGAAFGDGGDGGDGGNGGDGGGIHNLGVLELIECTLVANDSGAGGARGVKGLKGGVAQNDGANGTAGSEGVGGGIFNNGTNSLNRSTLSGNSARNGGGVYNTGSGRISIVNQCTLTSNSASGEGGGIYNGISGTLRVNQSTLSGNSAATGGAVRLHSGTFTLTNSIMAGNTASSADNLSFNTGTFSPDGNNLTNGVPLLGALDDYGGPTQTMLPLPGSPAVNGCTNGTDFATDQRGFPRIVGPFADIGAAEFELEPVVTTAADDGVGSLRRAIRFSTNGTVITFSNNLSGAKILLTSGQLLLTNNLTIDASALPGGFTIDGNANGRIFEVAGTTTNVLAALTITNGVVTNGGAGVLNFGNLTVDRCTFSGNACTGSAGDGGGINNQGGASLAVNQCTFSGNSAGNDGGALYNPGTAILDVNQSTISGNSAANLGGGIRIDSGTFTLTNSIVAGNTASSDANISGALAVTNNFTSGDPLLSPLGNYGGPTQTMPPLPGSPAIDAGNDAATNTFVTDQRGASFPRLSGLHVDIGAVESAYAPDAPLVVTQPATSVAFMSATLNAFVTPNGAVTACYFEYGTTTNYGSVTPANTLSAPGVAAVNVDLTEVPLSGGYHFRAVASNTLGVAYGQDANFTPLGTYITTNNDFIVQQTELEGTNTQTYDKFGFSVAISGDTIVVGSPGTAQGNIYIFDRSGTTWIRRGPYHKTLPANGEELGHSVAVRGKWIAAGAPLSTTSGVSWAGKVQIYKKATSGVWNNHNVLQSAAPEAGAKFGYSVATAGDNTLVGTPYEDDVGVVNGVVRTYKYLPATDSWAPDEVIIPANQFNSALFGWSIAMPDATNVVVGSPGYSTSKGRVEVYRRRAFPCVNCWERPAHPDLDFPSFLKNADKYGTSVAWSGDTIVVGAPGRLATGRAYVYKYNGTNFILQAELVPIIPSVGGGFGTAVAVSGDTVVVGGYYRNTVDVFVHSGTTSNGTTWRAQQLRISTNSSPSGDGQSVAISGDTIVVGDPQTNKVHVFYSQPLQITSITPTNANDVLLTWDTRGTTNTVQTATAGASGSFSPDDFTDLTNIVITTATASFLDVGALTNNTARYYRIRSP